MSHTTYSYYGVPQKFYKFNGGIVDLNEIVMVYWEADKYKIDLYHLYIAFKNRELTRKEFTSKQEVIDLCNQIYNEIMGEVD